MTSEWSDFFCILGGIRPSYSWILAYVELGRINQGTTFPNGIIFKLASKFLLDDVFLMAASKPLPYLATTAVCGCSGYITNEGRVVSTILTQIILGIQERARWRRYEWLRYL